MYNIEKLNEMNYDSWSLQIRVVLIHQDLWSALVTTNQQQPVKMQHGRKGF